MSIEQSCALRNDISTECTAFSIVRNEISNVIMATLRYTCCGHKCMLTISVVSPKAGVVEPTGLSLGQLLRFFQRHHNASHTETQVPTSKQNTLGSIAVCRLVWQRTTSPPEPADQTSISSEGQPGHALQNLFSSQSSLQFSYDYPTSTQTRKNAHRRKRVQT